MKEIKEKTNYYIFKILTYFTVGSFAGCIYETIYCYLKSGVLESRQGLIYGPFSQVYGIGVVLAVLILEKFKKENKKGHIYIFGAIICGMAEYLCSWVQEVVFHSISWDYSKYILNINGRTSLIHMLFWGVLIYLFMEYIYPRVEKIIDKISNKKKFWISVFVIVFFAINIFISSYACIRQEERKDNIPATNNLQSFFDKHFPDEFLDIIYPNKKIKK